MKHVYKLYINALETTFEGVHVTNPLSQFFTEGKEFSAASKCTHVYDHSQV